MSDAGSFRSNRDPRPSTSHLNIDPLGAEIIDLDQLVRNIPSKQTPELFSSALKRERSNEDLKNSEEWAILQNQRASQFIKNQNIEEDDEEKEEEEEEEFEGYGTDSPLSSRNGTAHCDHELPQNPNTDTSVAQLDRFKSKLVNTNSMKNQTLMKFTPLHQSEDLANQAHKKSKLNKIYSDTETSNFDPINGKRLYNDDKFRRFTVNNSRHSPLGNQSPITWNMDNNLRTLSQAPFANGMNLKVKRFAKENPGAYYNHNKRVCSDTDMDTSMDGMEDEYIPNFDFRYVLKKWASNDKGEMSIVNSLVPQSRSGSGINSHAQVEPVPVPVAVPLANNHTETDSTDSFEDALNDPSLSQHERIVMQRLPYDFRDLPFTARKRLVRELSEEVSESVINEVVKRRFKKKSMSLANSFLSSFSERKSLLKETDSGFVIMGHKLGRLLGHGAWGLVRECTGPNGEERAMKIIKTDTDGAKRFFKRETDVWAQMEHDHTLKLISCMVGTKAIFCLCEKVKNGTLFDIASGWNLFSNPEASISQDERLIFSRNYALQLAHALNYMHKKGFVHGDVKLENCLLQGSKLLLADFGMSMRYTNTDLFETTPATRRPSIVRSVSENGSESERSAIQRIVGDVRSVHDDTKQYINQTPQKKSPSKFDARPFEPPTEESPITYRLNKTPSDENLPHSHIGSLPYAAPELLETNPVPLGPSADIWAFGVTLFTLIVGKLPFHYSYEPKIKAMISAVIYDIDSLKKACLLRNGNRSRLYEVVVGCLTKDLNKRLTMDQILALLKAS
ncbi:hypothetical protein WICPIJ_003012 [Wickerhamomyces pijperi]|uniref:Protein kinase domain-containing protein n=1 Tax=Wickerhamomyces pijperi TaxID=599730 RepID=A0A9P8Q7V8_WICPI|nr:hypothetical protein WICPIJ_003012 [Wickerhamomyces pijperi]